MVDAPRLLMELSAEESLRLLGGVSVGRVVFTMDALPAIRPVNHVVDDGTVVIRSHEGAAIVAAARGADEGVVVAYEADRLDEDQRLGWSVIVTGWARLVTDPAEAARYERTLRPWVAGAIEYLIRIHPDQVTGFRFVEDRSDDPDVDVEGAGGRVRG